MQFVNGLGLTIADDGTTFLTLMVQFPNQEPKEVAGFIMSETTALMLADTINKTSQQSRLNRKATQ